MERWVVQRSAALAGKPAPLLGLPGVHWRMVTDQARPKGLAVMAMQLWARLASPNGRISFQAQIPGPARRRLSPGQIIPERVPFSGSSPLKF